MSGSQCCAASVVRVEAALATEETTTEETGILSGIHTAFKISGLLLLIQLLRLFSKMNCFNEMNEPK